MRLHTKAKRNRSLRFNNLLHHITEALLIKAYNRLNRKSAKGVDADISQFFDQIDHSWLMKFLQHRIADKRLLQLIEQTLKADVVEDNRYSKTVAGTPQGAVISPLLANIYLHYVLDLWVNQWRKRNARGEC